MKSNQIKLFTQIDISGRPTQYESGGCPKDHSDFYCPMYPPLNHVIRVAMRPGRSTRLTLSERPIILCEYQHAMGNSNGSIVDYWRAFERLNRVQGGFIWDWADQVRGINEMNSLCLKGLLKSKKTGDQTIVYYWAYGGDFNDLPNDKNFNINGLIDPDRKIKPGIIETKWAQQPVDIGLESLVLDRSSTGHPTSGSVILRIRSKLTFTSLSLFK